MGSSGATRLPPLASGHYGKTASALVAMEGSAARKACWAQRRKLWLCGCSLIIWTCDDEFVAPTNNRIAPLALLLTDIFVSCRLASRAGMARVGRAPIPPNDRAASMRTAGFGSLRASTKSGTASTAAGSVHFSQTTAARRTALDWFVSPCRRMGIASRPIEMSDPAAQLAVSGLRNRRPNWGSAGLALAPKAWNARKAFQCSCKRTGNPLSGPNLALARSSTARLASKFDSVV